MSDISPRTAELALTALGVAMRLAAPRRNGSPIPEDWRAAFVELHQASTEVGTTLDSPPTHVTASEEIDVTTAAARLGISERAVRKRISAGHLSARKVGAFWLIEWEQEPLWQ